MSGSGNGGGPSPFGPTDQTCENLSISTQLTTPDPDVVATLRVNDVLTITASSAVGPVQAVTRNGAVAGAIVTRGQADLLNCINSGHQYKAVVRSITGGNCEVLITIR